MMNRTISIRSIQHYMYCPRRFALLEINDDWAENVFVVKGNLMHERVHSGERSFNSARKVVRSDVTIYYDAPEYDMFGVADCIEFLRNKNGVYVESLADKFIVQIVEYKPTKPKNQEFHESDAIQVYAQKLCVDAIFQCNSECFLYYADIRRRVKLPFETQGTYYDELLRKYLMPMRQILESHVIPKRVRGQKCSGCSLSDLCFPKEKSYSVRDQIASMNGGEK